MELTNRSESTSTSLILRAKSLDQDAWKRIVLLYTPTIYGWAQAAGLQDDDAEDVVQEVFQAMTKGISKVDLGPDQPAFRAWLWGITRHKIIDLFRKQAAAPAVEGGSNAQRRFMEIPEAEPGSDAGSGTHNSFAQHDSLAYRALELVKQDFHETTWRAFWRVTIDRAPAAGVAEDLGISIGAVYTAKSRVLKHIRKELDGMS